MRITIEGDTDKVLDFLEDNGVRISQGLREYDFNGWDCWVERAEQVETYLGKWIPSRSITHIVMLLEKTVSKEQLAAEEAVRKAKQTLAAAEETLKRLRRKNEY